MGWSLGWDSDWERDIGYGVIAYCDHPDCNEEIDRGLAYVCKNQEPHGGDGCGLYFCSSHQSYLGECEQCEKGKEPFTPKPEHPHWAWWKMNSKSWMEWRSGLPFGEREPWKLLASKYKPSKDDLEEAEEDE